MKKAIALIVLALAMLASNSSASILSPGNLFLYMSDLGSNITINDGLANSTYNGGSPALNQGGEDNETEQRPNGGNTVTSQSWDLEGIFWNSTANKLTIIGGFNYLTGNSNEDAGDIFIGNNFVLDLSRIDDHLQSAGTYVSRKDYSSTIAPNYVTEASPYQYLSGGSEGTGGSYVAGRIANWNSIDLFSGWRDDDNHYALVLNTAGAMVGGNSISSLINHGDQIHFTLECGNDLILGKVVSVPEPGTFGLFSLGLTMLLGMGLFNKKRKNS
jgi:hypothetical protein